jgi:hypothetical protein
MSFVLGTAGVKRATVAETDVALSGFYLDHISLQGPAFISGSSESNAVIVVHQDVLGKIRFTSYAYDGDGTFSGATQERQIDNGGGTISNYSACSLGETKFFCSGRVGAGASPAFASDGVIVEGLKDGAAGTVSTDMFAANGANREFYNGPMRMGATNFVCWSGSNHAGGYAGNSTAGSATFTLSAKTGGFTSQANGGGGSNLYDPNFIANAGGPKRVGGTGSLRARGGNGAEFVFLNNGTNFSDQTNFDENGTQLDVVHHLWDGTSGSTITQTKNADDITLPSHTGSTQRPFLLTCSWGNAVIHVDTNANTGAIFPITWSSSTSNVGSSVATDFQGVPLNELTLANADGYGSDSSPVSSQEIDTDRFYLLRLFHVGSGTGIQSCELVIRSDGTHDFRIIKDIPTPTAFSSINLKGTSLTEVYNVNFDARGFPQDCVIAYGSGTNSGDIIYIHDAFT